MNKLKVKLTVFEAEAKDSESLGESDYLLNHQEPTGNSLGSFVRKPKKTLRSDIPQGLRQTANQHKHFVEQLHQITSHTCRYTGLLK